MLYSISSKELLLLFCSLLTIGLSLADDSEPEQQDDQAELPFPVPIETTGGRLHIISEEFNSDGGYFTWEEFIDLTIGKATIVRMKSSGRETFHMDAASQSSYYYEPYECLAYNFPVKPQKMAQSGFWLNEQFAGPFGGEFKRMYLTGVSAIWLNAKNLPKIYSKASSIYSASKDIYLSAHKWQAKMGDTKASFYFHETSKRDNTLVTSTAGTDDDVMLTLETIELETGDQKTTINVLAYDFDIEDSVYMKELQLPLSYGCYQIGATTGEVADLIERVELTKIGHRFKVEAVATKQEGEKRSTDTISLMFIRSPVSDATINGSQPSLALRLMRQRNSRVDIKTVLDHTLNVKYDIDMLKGTCSISNAGKGSLDKKNLMNVQFPNGLELKIDRYLLDILFFENFKQQHFEFTKSVDEDEIKYVYMTMPSAKIFGEDKKAARIVRKYSIRNQYVVKLDSVTMWLLNEPATSKSDISEIYHFTILESRDFSTAMEKARTFDISEECYLDNEKEMKFGRDYAWLELHYSVPVTNEIKRIPKRLVKHMFYENMRKYAGIGYFRIPRLEMMIDEVGFTLRMLMLDSPPLHAIFDRTDGMAIELKDGDDQVEYFKEIAPDLRHCSELCRLNRCLAYSFCANSYSCILGHSAQDSSLETRIVPRSQCTLFKMPVEFEFLNYHESRLQHFIGQMQRHDLSNNKLPPRPEELSVPRSESGLSVEEENRLKMTYAVEMTKSIQEIGLNSVGIFYGSLFMVPDSFEMEQDPLIEFGLDGKDELQPEDESEAPAFHEGLSQSKFNYKAFESQGDTGQLSLKREARRYVGIDYEQCALACVDGKCSSFSYCQQRQECIITNIWDLKTNSSQYIQPDNDCVIAQRDFLSKFHRLSEVKRPQVSSDSIDLADQRHVTIGLNPSECAHGCVVENSFNCLAFTFCRTDGAMGAGTCFYSKTRSLEPSQVKNNSNDYQLTNCDHYSRSYLADFTWIEYRQIQTEALNQLKTSQIEGQSVDRCAEMCATELMDCTAFQFCYDPEAQQQEARQRCTMIESPPEDKKDDYRIVINNDGKVVQAGKLFTNNQNCHVFTLRKGSSEAALRQLALNPLSADDNSDLNSPEKSEGLSLGGGLMLFFCSTLVFSIIGVAFVVAQRNSPRMRSRIDHLRALYGRYH